MVAVVHSRFGNQLKYYMKKVNDEYEPLIAVIEPLMTKVTRGSSDRG